MKVGVTLPSMIPGTGRELLLRWARRADEGPFSCVSTGELVAGPAHDAMTTLAAAAAVTTRVRLMTNVLGPAAAPGRPARQAGRQHRRPVRRPPHAWGWASAARSPCCSRSPATPRRTRTSPTTPSPPLPTRAGPRGWWPRSSGCAGSGRGRSRRPGPGRPGRRPSSRVVPSCSSAASPRRPCGGRPRGRAGSRRSRTSPTSTRWPPTSTSPGRPGARPAAASPAWWRPATSRSAPRPRRAATPSCERHYHHLGAEGQAKIGAAITTVSEAALRGVLRRLEDLGADEVVPVPMVPELAQVDRLADLVA